jgi:broad specificity phosphatase PhoE
MSIKTIFLIRHGETDYNKRGIVQGSGIDAELNELGHKQAQAFYQHYKHVPFQKIYTSQLIRTHQSVTNFIKDDVPHEVLSGLNEISWGVKEGQAPSISNRDYYLDIMRRWNLGETHIGIEKGESPEDVVKRQKPALEKILSNTAEELVLIAMHGRALRILLTQICQVPLSSMDSFEHQNLCLYKLIYSYATNTFDVIEKNNVRHLENIS